MNDELVEHQLEVHDKRLNNHADRLDKLEQDSATLKSELKNLCENLRALTSVMKWFIGLLIGSFIGFFFYAVQNNIFK
ncbi:Haemolysin XhlA [Hathewaya proteolytica DSM 3090]|uniref:Haemolysin XhlA n=1 Tax=Hathewaya proteolytica DSM 3090 TaxID=1121331 RepID=A0A1M6RYX1_9CLOT|nr:hemolysin XhlA family protein [Hathewaya proteolytica]SHK37651.1 Haemolysin XhlA [Hathewaya proteolytica DSM 3090]